MKKWNCFEIHSYSLEDRNNLLNDIVRRMQKLKQNSNLKKYFFNRYSTPQKNLYFIKLGLFGNNKKSKLELDNVFKNHKIKEIKPYNCEMWEVDNVPIDEIKSVSCELFEKIKDNFPKKITLKQAFYLIHFFFNQFQKY